MEQEAFEQAMLAILRQAQEPQQIALLQIVQAFINEGIEPKSRAARTSYNVERHQEIRKLTATLHGPLSLAISAERDERG